MNKQSNPLIRPRWALLAVLALAGAASAAPPTKAELADAIARHRAEVALCNAGQTNQTREDCIRDADGALVVAKRGDLDDGSTPYERNQKLRCQPLPEVDRKDCMARMQGAGVVKGSVASGGIYRELKTIEVGPVPPTPAAQPHPAMPPAAEVAPVPPAPAAPTHPAMPSAPK